MTDTLACTQFVIHLEIWRTCDFIPRSTYHEQRQEAHYTWMLGLNVESCTFNFGTENRQGITRKGAKDKNGCVPPY